MSAISIKARSVAAQSAASQPWPVRRFRLLLSLAALGVLALAIVHLAIGTVLLSPVEVALTLAGHPTLPYSTVIVWDLRMPRTLIALVAGGMLALAGAILQAVMRNPLAEPDMTGATSGAVLFAVFWLVGPGQSADAAPLLPLVALVGGLLASGVVYLLGGAGRYLILTGLLTSAVLRSATSFLLLIHQAGHRRDRVLAHRLAERARLGAVEHALAVGARGVAGGAGLRALGEPVAVGRRQRDWAGPAGELGARAADSHGGAARGLGGLRRRGHHLPRAGRAASRPAYRRLRRAPPLPVQRAVGGGDPALRRCAVAGRALAQYAARGRGAGADRRAVLLVSAGQEGAMIADEQAAQQRTGAKPDDERVLAAESVSAGYNRQLAIEQLSLSFARGTITALVGPNGSGKSTVLKALARILAPRSGAVYLEGQAIARLPTREVARRLAILPQGPTAPDELTVRELVEQGRYPHAGPLRALDERDAKAIDEALVQTNMTALRFRRLDSLSGGERQRAWIALALAQATPILLLDEPTTFLDVGHQLEVLDLVRGLQQARQMTLVLVLHDLNQAARYAGRMVVLRAGRIVADGAPSAILTPSLLADVFRVRAEVLRHPVDGYPICLPYATVSPDE